MAEDACAVFHEYVKGAEPVTVAESVALFPAHAVVPEIFTAGGVFTVTATVPVPVHDFESDMVMV